MGKGSNSTEESITTNALNKKMAGSNSSSSSRNSSMSKSSGSNSSSSSSSMSSKFSWSEVSQHNTKSDCWIVVDNLVYNLTNFKRAHPGGSRVLSHYAGQDATEVFQAFHKDFTRVNKFKKLYCIGEIEPILEQKISANSTSTTSTSTSSDSTKKNVQTRVDFDELKRVANEMDLFEPSRTFFVASVLQIVLCQLAGLYLAWNWNDSLPGLALSLMLLIVAQGQASWVQHDFGHSSCFSLPKHNRFVQCVLLGTVKGASSEWWRFMHNQHHAKPNVIDKDPDAGLAPVLVLGEVQPRRMAKKQLQEQQKHQQSDRSSSSSAPFLYPYSAQHFVFPLVGPLLFPFFFQYTTVKFAWSRRAYVDLFAIFSHFVLFFGVLVPAFNYQMSRMLAFYIVMRLIDSSWFAWVSQSNHIVMDIHDEASEVDKMDSWIQMQLRATCNIESSAFNDWFTGHLNFQIEHHLFPTMPRHNLYKIRPLVQSLCKKHDIDYVEKPLGQAFLDILLSLKKAGELWQECYDELKLAS